MAHEVVADPWAICGWQDCPERFALPEEVLAKQMTANNYEQGNEQS